MYKNLLLHLSFQFIPKLTWAFFAFVGLFCFNIDLAGQQNLNQADEYLKQLKERSVANNDSAIALCDNLTAFFKREKKPCKMVQSLSQRAIYLSNVERYEDALADILNARNLVEENNCDPTATCFMNFALADIYIHLNDSPKADSIGFKNLKICKEVLSDKLILTKLYLQVGMVRDDIEHSIPYLDTGYTLAKRYGYLELEQQALIDIGTTYAMNGFFDKASDYLKLALKVARKRNDINNLGLLYNNLAGLTDDDDLIISYIDSALYFGALNKNQENEQIFNENKAYALFNMGKYKEAYEFLWKSVELRDTLFERDRYEAVVELEKKYEAEKKTSEIQALKLKNLNTEVEKLTYKRNQNTLLVGSMVLLVVLGVLAFNFVTIRKNRNLLAEKNNEISKERKRSDDLLLNILPEEIAQELKVTGKAKPKQFEVASILFTDFIAFTQTTERLTTEELVEELNYCFMGFDHILEKYGLEKIKTIGDSYMAAGGLPVPSEAATKKTVLAALDMQAFMKERRAAQKKVGKPSFEMRAGISTGPVVAGIVGVKKFQYDIWGDTVNTASRMESMGEANRVNISQSTYDLLKRDSQFVFENRGFVEAKGKGEIAMYFVELAQA